VGGKARRRRGEEGKVRFFIGFLEGKRRGRERDESERAAKESAVVVDSARLARSCFESIAAQEGQPPS
jgi:hypothetical protein